MELHQLRQELSYRTSRSSGAGGQNINKVETKVDLLFDVGASSLLNETQKHLLFRHLSNRINKEGILILSNQTSRSQLDNKEQVTRQFFYLIQKALTPPTVRKKVKPLTADKEKRLLLKKKISEKKAFRQKVVFL